ncbi:hypothetical protein [Leptolyngbya sp. FACHB-261]|uniref:hypothetical protein n=1 Tax=Leptolyngbya sp. FACHB-261 TaxID=2692806 RepID=UPI0016892EA7|nr:hypothetical protein [Leptolyngbya sp. FACHB-261]MBD2100849.1 hypothetical protein [Leptolyngbya sp. FACHB-261]
MTNTFLPVNSTISDTLGGQGDYYSAADGHYYDFYQLTNVAPGSNITVDVMGGTGLDTYLYLYNSASQSVVGFDDDGGGGTNSRLSFQPTFGDQDSYMAIVTSYAPNATGAYTIGAYYS